MPEKDIALHDFFTISKNQKPGKCCVSGCLKKERAPKRRLCEKHQKQWWRARNPTRDAYNQIKAHARERRIEFDLTFEELERIIEGTGYANKKGCSKGNLQIDRLDACKGYTADNIRVLPASHNIAKGNRERRSLRYRIALLTRLGYDDIAAELQDELMLFDMIRVPEQLEVTLPADATCPF
jgi:hypothetical protein